jgi:hypothetical protein
MPGDQNDSSFSELLCVDNMHIWILCAREVWQISLNELEVNGILCAFIFYNANVMEFLVPFILFLELWAYQ